MERLRFLVVDDQIAEILARPMKHVGECVLAKSFAEAQRHLFSEERFDAVILDVFLGDGNGLDLLAALRASDARNSRTPVLVTSGDGDSQCATAAFDLDAHYVDKPFSRERMARFIAMACSNVRIARTVEAWKTKCSLTPCEASILSLSAQGETREAILERRNISANTYKHHVSSLLQKTKYEDLEAVVAQLLRDVLDGPPGPSV